MEEKRKRGRPKTSLPNRISKCYRLPLSIDERVKAESIRSGRNQCEVVASILDKYLPI